MYRFGWNGEMTIEGGNPWGPRDAPLVENRWMPGTTSRRWAFRSLQGRLFDSA